GVPGGWVVRGARRGRCPGRRRAGRHRPGAAAEGLREVPGAVTSAPGARLHTMPVGTAGPRVAFLHGLFGQGRNRPQIGKALAGPDGTGARCLLVDLPDHGRSPWTQEFSYEAYATQV